MPSKTAEFGDKESASGGRFRLGGVVSTAQCHTSRAMLIPTALMSRGRGGGLTGLLGAVRALQGLQRVATLGLRQVQPVRALLAQGQPAALGAEHGRELGSGKTPARRSFKIRIHGDGGGK